MVSGGKKKAVFWMGKEREVLGNKVTVWKLGKKGGEII